MVQPKLTPGPGAIPVLIIGFNRPDKMEKLLDTLLKLGVRDVFVSLDGPRNSLDKVQCEATRFRVEDFSKDFNMRLVWRDYNLGCNLGVVAALDWFFEHNSFGIVLEDDCLPENSMRFLNS